MVTLTGSREDHQVMVTASGYFVICEDHFHHFATTDSSGQSHVTKKGGRSTLPNRPKQMQLTRLHPLNQCLAWSPHICYLLHEYLHALFHVTEANLDHFACRQRSAKSNLSTAMCRAGGWTTSSQIATGKDISASSTMTRFPYHWPACI